MDQIPSQTYSPGDFRDISRRGTTSSEVLVHDRAKLSISDCRTELADLRAAVKNAKSHREKSVNLLKHANDALNCLEDILYSPLANNAAIRLVHSYATRLHASIDQAEALVKIYGQMNGAAKLFSRVTAATASTEKFNAAAQDLMSIASDARVILAKSLTLAHATTENISIDGSSGFGGGSVPTPRGISTGLSGGGGSLATSSQPNSLPPPSSQSNIYPTQDHSKPPSTTGSNNTTTNNAAPVPPASVPLTPATTTTIAAATANPATRGSSGKIILDKNSSQSQISAGPSGFMTPSITESTDLVSSVLAANSVGRALKNLIEIPAGTIQRHQLRKPSRQDTVTAYAYLPPLETDPPGSVGKQWIYVNRLFSADKFVVTDISSRVETNIEWGRNEGPVSVMYLDPRGIMWTGHRSGYICVWDALKRTQLCSGTRACSSAVRALTTDEVGVAWAGTDKGHVRRLLLTQQTTADGALLDWVLKEGGSLKHTGTGTSDMSSHSDLDATGMVINKIAREKAHEGPVSSIAAAAGRVWTSGGSPAFVCFREWTSRGEFMQKQDMKDTGTATAMVLVSPVVRITMPVERSQSVASVMSTSPGSYGSPASTSNATNEVVQAWQLLTGHANGMIQVWGQVFGKLRPLLRIGTPTARVTGLSICESVGVVCSVHEDGRLLVQAFPNPRNPDAFTVPFSERSVSSIPTRPRGEVKATDAGIAGTDGGSAGIITISHDASVYFWPEASLRYISEEAGVATLPPLASMERWPVMRFNAVTAQRAQRAIIRSQQQGFSEYQAPRPVGLEGSDAATVRSMFPADASRWLIEYSELELDNVVGEGAFGKVWKGRWQETDVAIKVLTSLAALGLPTSSLAGKASSSLSPADIREALKTLGREVELMVAMRHPNVILFMGVCPEPPCVVTEYCSRGSLYDLLKMAREDDLLARQLHWPRRLGLALDAAKGMLYLHSHKPPIIHRDLKSPNLLVDVHWKTKVTDFNLSRLSESVPSVASSVVANNPRWHSPEIIRSHDFSQAGDVYAFGLILWELLTWELPFDNLSPFQIILSVGEKGDRPSIPDRTSNRVKGGSFPCYDEYVALMKACWAQDAADRPGFDQVIAALRAIGEKMAATGVDTGPTPVPLPLPPFRQVASTKFSEDKVNVGGAPSIGGPSNKFSDTIIAAVSNPSFKGASANGGAPPTSPFDSNYHVPVGGAPLSPFDTNFAVPPPPSVPVAANPHNEGGGYVSAPMSPFDLPFTATPAAATTTTTTDANGGSAACVPTSPFDAPSTFAAAAATIPVATDNRGEHGIPMTVLDSVNETSDGRLSSSRANSGGERSGALSSSGIVGVLSQEEEMGVGDSSGKDHDQDSSFKRRNTSFLRQFRDSLKKSDVSRASKTLEDEDSEVLQ